MSASKAVKTPPRPRYNRRELARTLEVSEKSLRNWEKLPGSPRTGDAAEWLAYIEKNNLAKGLGNEDIARLRAEKLEVEVAILKNKERRERGELIALQDVQSYLVNVSAKFDQLITQKLDVEGPARTVGKDIVALRSEFSQIHDEMRGVINAGLSGYGNAADEARAVERKSND